MREHVSLGQCAGKLAAVLRHRPRGCTVRWGSRGCDALSKLPLTWSSGLTYHHAGQGVNLVIGHFNRAAVSTWYIYKVLGGFK